MSPICQTHDMYSLGYLIPLRYQSTRPCDGGYIVSLSVLDQIMASNRQTKVVIYPVPVAISATRLRFSLGMVG